MSGVKTFFNYDLRTKLIKLNLYPKKFYEKGIKGFYSKIIFKLILNDKIKRFKKFNYNIIFNNSINKQDHKVNAFFALPRSGHTFLTCVISSYFELYYKIGNGIPKYDSLKNIYMFACSPVVAGDMYNTIPLSGSHWSYQHDFKDNLDFFISKNEFNKKKIIFSRFPINSYSLDMYDINKVNPAIILREPSDQLISWYLGHDESKNPSIVNQRLLDLGVQKYEKFINFWHSYLQNKNKDKDFIVIKYKDLNDNSIDLFSKILNFYSYDVDEDILKKSILINTKENVLKNIGDTKIRRIRFTDEKTKQLYREKILDTVKSKIENTEILKKFTALY